MAAGTAVLVADAIDLLVAATQTIAVLAPMVQAAQAAGRTTLTAAEWATIVGNDDSVEAALSAAVAAAKLAGR
jgi:hypothetical protein